MNKSLPILILGLCFFLQAIAAQETCDMRFFNGPINNKNYIYLEGDNVAPFKGWAWVDPYQQTDKKDETYTGLRAVQGGFCETCMLTVFSTATFGGKNEWYSFRNDNEFTFPFCVKSYILDCPIEFPEEEEEEEVTEEEEEEEEESMIDFEMMTPAEANSAEVNQIRLTGINEATRRLMINSKIPEGTYGITNINISEKATNFDDVYRFNVDVENEFGNAFRVVVMMVYNPNFFDLIDFAHYEI